MSIILGEGSYIVEPNEYWDPIVNIGNFTSMSSNINFFGSAQHPSVLDRDLVSNFPFTSKGYFSGYPGPGGNPNINIGNDVWVGQFVTILGGVSIGDGAIIGCNSVVAKDIPAYAIAVGNPCKVVKYRFDFDTIKKLEKIKWWEWDRQTIKNRKEYFLNINNFIKEFYE